MGINWNTGAIGIAVAFDRFEIAIALSLLNLLTLWVVGGVKDALDDPRREKE
jgi:putative Mg2+ transporter-C (MgtC) family protein